MNKLDAAVTTNQSVQNEQDYFERPKKRGNPSHADWGIMSDIIRDNIAAFSPNADFDEIAHTIEDLAKFNDIPLNKWARNYFTNKILDLCYCLNYFCQLKTSVNCLELTENETPQLPSLNLCQFKELTKKQQISFLLSHVSLVKEICKQFKFNK